MKKITNPYLLPGLLSIFVINVSCGLFAPSEDGYLKNYAKAHEYMVQNQPYKAIPLYKKVLKQKEDFASAYQEIAVCLQMIGENDSAIVYYEGAIVYNPRNVDAYQSIGNIYYMRGNYDEAITWYDRATAVDDLYPRSYNNMATFLLSRGNIEKAKDYCELSITVDATYPRAYYGLGIIAWQQGDVMEAEARFLDAVKVGSMPEAIYMLGQLNFEMKAYDKAKEWFERYLEKEPIGEWAEKAKDMLLIMEQNNADND
jgi:Tfp pilus assembly protein PilF